MGDVLILTGYRLDVPHCIRCRECYVLINKSMSILSRSSDSGVILTFRLPISKDSGIKFEKFVTRYSGATVQVFHLLPILSNSYTQNNKNKITK